MRQDSNSDLDLVTEPKWRVLHLIRRGLGSGVQLPTEYRVRAPGCRMVVHPATVGLLRAQQNPQCKEELNGTVRRNDSQPLSISGPRTQGCMSQARAGEARTRGCLVFKTLKQAVSKLPTPKHTESQHFIYPTAMVSDEEALTFLRPWAWLQAPGPPCYK